MFKYLSENFKLLQFNIAWMENIGIGNSTIAKFFEHLPVVENLSIYPWTVMVISSTCYIIYFCKLWDYILFL